MPGQMFQGLQMTTGDKRPPPQLLDMEMTLQAMPLKEQDNDYIIKDIHNAKPPAMPQILSNRLVIPDCGDILKSERTKIRWGEGNDAPARVEKMAYHNSYQRPGSDTKREWKDKFSQFEKKNRAANTDVYGIGLYDKRALKPGTNPKCHNADSDLDCMHVYGPDAERTGKVIDPTLTLGDLAGRPGGPGTDSLAASVGLGDSAASKVGSVTANPETQRVAATINPTTPYINYVRDSMARAGCNARFYDYSPKGC